MGASVKTAALPVLILVAVTMAGCLGGEARSEWAYDITQLDNVSGTGSGVRIGVLDTGIDVSHPSLDHLVDGAQGNGELMGFRDFIDGRFGVPEAHDDHGHGTHVVGIMAGRGSSFQDRLLYGGIDLQGGSQDSLYYVAKVCADTCDTGAVNQALDWLVKQRVDIISMSLGGDRNVPALFGDPTQTRIQNAIRAGIVVIASAGNSAEEPDSDDVEAPSDVQGVISVGAIGEDLRVAEFSNRGKNDGENACFTFPFSPPRGRCDPNKKPEVVAPGVDILSAWTEGNYVRASGTSQAAPFVTSVVAVMLEGKPLLRNEEDVMEIKQVLMDTARKLPGQDVPHDDAYGYGVVQAQAAIAAYG